MGQCYKSECDCREKSRWDGIMWECTRCGHCKPKNAKFFHYSKARGDYENYCVSCLGNKIDGLVRNQFREGGLLRS